MRRDHRDRERLLGRGDVLEVRLGARVVVVHLREVRERLAEALGALLEHHRATVDLLVLDLLLEERGEDDGGGARGLERAERVEVAGQRRRRRDRAGSSAAARGTCCAGRGSCLLLLGRGVVGLVRLVLDLGHLLVDEAALVDVVLREGAEPLGLLGPRAARASRSAPRSP